MELHYSLFKQFLQDNPSAEVNYVDTEGTILVEALLDRTSRTAKIVEQADKDDFNTNFASSANQQLMPPRTGVAKAARLTVPVDATSFVIPSDTSFVCVMNTDLTLDLRINFDDQAAVDFVTLKPGEISPIVSVRGNTTVNLDPQGGPIITEILTWG